MLEFCQVLWTPTSIIAHQFGSIGEFVAIDTAGQRDVGIATHVFVASCPCHENADGSIGVGLRACNFPNKGVLIGHRSTTRHVHVVLAAAATTDDGFNRPSSNAALGILAVTEYIEGRCNGRVASSQQLLDAVEVGLGVQTARMDKTMLRSEVAADCLHIKSLAGLQSGKCIGELCDTLVDIVLADTSCSQFQIATDDFVLQFGDGIGRILTAYRSNEGLALGQFALERSKVAWRAVSKFVVQVGGHISQRLDFSLGQSFIINAEVIDQRLLEIVV